MHMLLQLLSMVQCPVQSWLRLRLRVKLKPSLVSWWLLVNASGPGWTRARVGEGRLLS